MEKETKQAIIKEFAQSEGDVGSADVQIAVLSARIKEITDHLKSNKKDHSSRRGLIAMVNRRRKLLNYVNSKDHAKYLDLIKRLELRR
ncbi:MAG: 30S ribosomal protein S15 [Lentisphaeria bacterium]|nr:30S ribosomal protein S15 [Lentisphaeria bacterium]